MTTQSAPTDPPFTLGPLAARVELTRFETAMRTLQQAPEGSWLAEPGVLTCDGGALAAALVAGPLGIPAILCVGLYWHTDSSLRAELMGDHPDEDDVDGSGWQEHLRWVERNAMDEHHHWVVLYPDSPTDALLIDPNGPGRDEPYAQLVHAGEAHDPPWGTEDRRYTYSELHPGDPDRALAYDPDDEWGEIADDVYPGLRAAVAAAVDAAIAACPA